MGDTYPHEEKKILVEFYEHEAHRHPPRGGRICGCGNRHCFSNAIERFDEDVGGQTRSGGGLTKEVRGRDTKERGRDQAKPGLSGTEADRHDRLAHPPGRIAALSRGGEKKPARISRGAHQVPERIEDDRICSSAEPADKMGRDGIGSTRRIRRSNSPAKMKPGDLVLIRDGHRMYFQNPEDVPKGGIAGIFLEVKTADWCSDFFVYRFLTQRGVMELIMEEKNAAKCLSML